MATGLVRAAGEGTDAASSEPFREAAPTWDQLAPIVEVAVAAAVVGALWALRKWQEERRRLEQERRDDQQRRDEQQREAEVERLRLERERLDQLAREEATSRADRAATLIGELGDADDTTRWWRASALSMYPDEALPVLVSALGHAEPKTLTALATALLSIGAPSIEPLARANRIASSLARERRDGDGSDPFVAMASTMLDNSRTVLAHLVLHLNEEERAQINLENIDLCGSFFRGADLSGLRLRKADISDCDFARAKLRAANLRGATGKGAVFTKANLNNADLTGYTGPSGFVSAKLNGATLSHANVVESDFANARLEDADLERCRMDQSSLRGAVLVGAELKGTQMSHVDAYRIDLSRTTLERVRAGGMNLAEGGLGGAAFTQCYLTNAHFDSAKASEAAFVDCNLGGATFRDAILRGATFRRCNLGGTDFAGADMSGATVEACKLYGFTLGEADLTDVNFVGPHEFDVDGIGAPTNATWQQADYDERSSRLLDALNGALSRSAGS